LEDLSTIKGALGAISGGKLHPTVIGDVNAVQWNAISLTAACEQNSDGIERTSYSENVPNLNECKRACEEFSQCSAVDYYSKGAWCNFYNDACTTPRATHAGATSARLTRGSGVKGYLVYYIDLPSMVRCSSLPSSQPPLETMLPFNHRFATRGTVLVVGQDVALEKCYRTSLQCFWGKVWAYV
jgi:hypothetical protein